MKMLSLMKIFSLFLVVSLVAGCSTFSDSDEAAELEPADLVDDYSEEVEIDKLWSTGVGKQNPLFSSLNATLVDGVIYAADDGGKVVAIDAGNGKITWKADVDRDISGGVGVGGGLVMVASLEGRVFALKQTDGSLVWETRIGSEVLSAPASNGQAVVVQTLDGFLVGLNAIDGSELWRYRVDIPSLTLRSATSPVMTYNTVVAGFASGKVLAFNPSTGALLWENRVSIPKGRSELERMVDIAGSPILVGDVIYVSSYQGRAAAITRGTGRSLWFKDLSSYRQPAFGQDQIYLTQTNDEVKALRANSGQEMWSNVQMTYRQLTAPAAAGNFVAVGDADGYLHVLSATDGRYVGRRKVDGSGLNAPLLSSGDVVYVQDNSGDISAFRLIPQ